MESLVVIFGLIAFVSIILNVWLNIKKSELKKEYSSVETNNKYLQEALNECEKRNLEKNKVIKIYFKQVENVKARMVDLEEELENHKQKQATIIAEIKPKAKQKQATVIEEVKPKAKRKPKAKTSDEN